MQRGPCTGVVSGLICEVVADQRVFQEGYYCVYSNDIIQTKTTGGIYQYHSACL